MLRVRFNTFALAACSRLASVDAKSAATELAQQIETVVKTIQSPTVRAKASAYIKKRPEMLAMLQIRPQPHRHNLLRENSVLASGTSWPNDRFEMWLTYCSTSTRVSSPKEEHSQQCELATLRWV
jgi:hypothetical protein